MCLGVPRSYVCIALETLRKDSGCEANAVTGQPDGRNLTLDAKSQSPYCFERLRYMEGKDRDRKGLGVEF